MNPEARIQKPEYEGEIVCILILISSDCWLLTPDS
jgi:hypothetical protein